MSRLPLLAGLLGPACLLVLLARPACAQSPPAPADSTLPASAPAASAPASSDSTLRLPDLLRAAAESNPSLQSARLRAEARAAEPDQARALPDPVVGATYFPLPILTARGAQRTQWRAQQSLPFPGKRALKGEVARLTADAARADADALAEEVALRVRRAYYTLYAADRRRRLIRRFQSDLQQFEDAALAQYEVGSEGQPAVLKAQIERQRLDVRLETIAAERARALHTLARLTGRPSLPETAASASVAAPDVPPLPPSTSSPGDALDRRPEARALRAEIDRSERRIDLAEKDRWPDVTLGVQYVDVAERDVTPSMDGRDALALSVGVQVPLWGGKQAAQIEEAEVERRRAEADLDAFALEVRTRIADLRQQIDRQRRQLSLLEDTLLPKAETALEATLSGYQTGSNDFLDLLDAQRTLFQLRLDRVSVRTRLLESVAELERAAGQTAVPPPDR